MMRLKLKLIYLLSIAGAAICAPLSAGAQLRINEIMQSNVGGVLDDLNEFPDSWVELYNTGSEAVDLSQYSIGLEAEASTAYRLPAMTIEPGAFQLVYCDKEGTALHTDFRLDSGKGSLYLFCGAEPADSLPSIKKMPAPGVAYGRKTEDSDKWGYQAQPTPGAPNCGSLVKELLPAPLFSEPGGVRTEPLELALSLPEDAPEGARILYTLDGSAPAPADTLTCVYTEPLHIDASVCVRAVAEAEGHISPTATTQSYIFHPREQTLPVVSISCDPDYFYSDELGIYSDHVWSDDKMNYEHDWRRPVNIEYFQTDGTAPVNQLCEVRVKGAYSRRFGLKSLAVYANKRFGTKRFDYEFFPGDKPGITDFKSIELRNGGNNFIWLPFRDAYMQHMFGVNTNVDFSAYQPTIFYINGVYKGLINVRERTNEDYVYSNYAGLEDIALVENYWELKAGTAKDYFAFCNFYSQTHSLAEWNQVLDVDEFLNVWCAEAIFNNNDFPNNNSIYWRPLQEGGRWRFILKDLDCGLGLSPHYYPDFPFFDRIWHPEKYPQMQSIPDISKRLFLNLLANEDAKNKFIDKMAVYMGDFLRAEFQVPELQNWADVIETEYQPHREVYGYEEWSPLQEQVDLVQRWITERIPFMYGHIADFFVLGTPVPLSINDAEASAPLHVALNGIGLRKPGFDGCWFAGRSLTLTLADNDTEAGGVQGWRMDMAKNGEVTSVLIASPEFTEADFPLADRVTLTPLYELSGIDALQCAPAPAPVYYDLQGRCLGTSRPTAPGIYVQTRGTVASKFVVR